MISLSIAKLSTAQDAHPNEQAFEWKHETNNLICVIDSYRVGGSALELLKVVQGTQVREQIEIERLIRESQDLARDMQQRGIELKGEQLPISAIVRCPLFAVRWQLSNQKVRRLQIRFKSNSDYNLIYSHLNRLGLRMMPPQSQARDRGPDANQGQSRPVTQTSDGTIISTAERSGPSCPPSRLSEISSRPFTAMSAPITQEPRFSDTTYMRPSTAFATSPDLPSSSPLRPPVYFPRPDSSSGATFPPRDRPIASVEHHDTPASRPEIALLYERPNTAELPPRRELPFSRDSLPTSSGSDHNRSSSRPSTALMGPPPLPSRVSDLRPSSARAVSLDGELPPLRQPTIVAETARTISICQRPSSPLPPPTLLPKSEQPIPVHEDRHAYSPASSSPQTYSTFRPTSRSTSRPFTPISNRTPDLSKSTQPKAFTPPATFRDKAQADRTYNPFLSAEDENALKAYAMQSGDGRKAALDDFILRSLDNDDFLKLVEDMEANWARIGLGMW